MSGVWVPMLGSLLQDRMKEGDEEAIGEYLALGNLMGVSENH